MTAERARRTKYHSTINSCARQSDGAARGWRGVEAAGGREVGVIQDPKGLLVARFIAGGMCSYYFPSSVFRHVANGAKCQRIKFNFFSLFFLAGPKDNTPARRRE